MAAVRARLFDAEQGERPIDGYLTGAGRDGRAAGDALVGQRQRRVGCDSRRVRRGVRSGVTVTDIWVPRPGTARARTRGGAFCPTGDLFFPLKRFQRRFVARVLSPGIRRAALSLPRGNGKSWLAGYLVAESLRPGGALFRAGDENVLLSGSFDQARYVYRFAKGLLGEAGYTYQDNKQQMGIHHLATGTRLLVKSSRARGAFGIVGARIAIADEPGAWDVIGGQMMADALDTALGQTGQRSCRRLHRHAGARAVGMVAGSDCGWDRGIDLRASAHW